jgi:hypothetical protein
MTGRQLALQIAGAIALAWWIFAVAATRLFTVHLPYPQDGSQPAGCYLASDWFTYVQCEANWGGNLLGGMLTWAQLWTTDADVLMQLSSIPILMPLIILWLSSIFLAASFLFHLFSRACQSH